MEMRLTLDFTSCFDGHGVGASVIFRSSWSRRASRTAGTVALNNFVRKKPFLPEFGGGEIGERGTVVGAR